MKACPICGAEIVGREGKLTCSQKCSCKLNRMTPTACECGRPGVKRLAVGWACQRCLDIEAMNDRATARRAKMRELAAKVGFALGDVLEPYQFGSIWGGKSRRHGECVGDRGGNL